MHRRHLGLAVLSLAAAAGCALPGDPPVQAGASSSCIDPARVRSHEVVSNDEIRFTLAGGEVWSSRLKRTCPGLKAQGGFSWDVSTSICPGLQTIYVNESGIPCQLGEFTRVSTGAPQG